MLVIGVDGARGGWVAAAVTVDGSARVRLVDTRFIAHIGAVLTADVAVAAVDMPIGLPESGARACDRDARALLRPHGSRVFPAPARATLSHVDDYAAACTASRAIAGVALSKQAWNLLPKIIEVDAVADDARIVECHPEVAFALMKGSVVAASKKSATGAAERLELLRAALALPTDWAPPRLPGSADDVLDAIACAWSAARIARGESITLGRTDGNVPHDACGRPMVIRA